MESEITTALLAATGANTQEALTTAVAEIEYPQGHWDKVFSTVATGLLVVFIILIVLVFIFWLMGKIMTAITNKKKKPKNEAKAESAPEAAAVVADEPEVQDETDDDEIIAVISAAIAAYGASDGKQYRIASISKKRERNMRSNWSSAGIAENTRPF